MFSRLKDRLKGALSVFSKKTEEEAEVKEEAVEKVVEEPKEEVKKERKEKEIKEAPKKETEAKKENVLIFHGWEDNSESGFIPALKRYLAENNYEAKSFDQPDTEEPKFEEWFSFAEDKIKDSDKENLNIVGHSMGGLLSLKLAERYKVKKLILVAPVGSKPSNDYFKQFREKLNPEELEIFKRYQDRPLDIKKIKSNVKEIAFVFGLKDPWITEEIRNFYARSFKDAAEIHLFDEHAHMSESEGIKDLPLLKELFARKFKPGIVEHKKEKEEVEDKKKKQERSEEEIKEEAIEKKEKIEGVKITYFVHGTTTDNEEEKATGWNQGKLSKLGIEQTKELGKLVGDKSFDVVFCSDLNRAVDSANLGFKDKYEIIQDKRLRECNYGDWNGKKKDWEIIDYVEERYPNGENYKDVEKRIVEFLNYLSENFNGKHIAIVAHQAPQLALDVLLKGKTWKEAIKEDWREKKAWQPGWEYELKEKIEIKETIKDEPKKSFFKKIFSKKEEVIEEKAEEKTKEKAEEKKTEPKEKKEIKVKEAMEEEAKKEKKAEEKTEKPEEQETEQPEKKSFFSKVKQTLTTKTISAEKFEELFWDLELVLLENNVSVEVIEKIKEDLKSELVDKPLPRDVPKKIEETLKETLAEILAHEKIDLIKRAKEKKGPFVIALFGINGTGKTTSIAKLANYFQENKLSVVLAACDTFRAAAIQQLEEHANRLGVKIIKHDYGSDAAAVAFDAIRYAEKNNVDVVMIDTAGRLHSNTNLMGELKKIIMVTNPDLKIFVGESITGNDCIEQAKRFNDLVEMDGAILTKADVDEKGGAPLSISYTIKKPILFLGVGQEYKDLEEFNPEIILQRLGF